ncbi:putative RNA-directed DNA polymerase [Lupinus albus]|uniref:Putative RNA-directed DNA polymerase n=1 Tax=Lupinus albus TaxID=3870 RepID=A0A6A4NX52_LUPAL|nr:putative RNA-directed DNA polymerase [Lupinus albus]
MANNTMVFPLDGDGSTLISDMNKETPTSSRGFTEKEVQEILALLNQNKGNLVHTRNSVVNTTMPTDMHSSSPGIINHQWLLDTGATYHITYDLSLFSTRKNIPPILITLPNGQKINTSISGTVRLTNNIELKDVLFVPHFQVNLVSVHKLVKTLQCHLIFSQNQCVILQNISKKMIGSANLQQRLYALNLGVEKHSLFSSSVFQSLTNKHVETSLWHMRFGHVSKPILQLLSKQFSFSWNKNILPCDVRHISKQKKLPFSLSATHTTKSFDLLHVDIWGPYAVPSIFGQKYFLTLVDDYSRFTWIILMKSKAETRVNLIKFISYIETQFSTKLKCLKSDNGVEILMNDFLASKGIIHQRTCIETPQQNGIVERKHQHILNVARSLFFHSCIPSKLWNFSIQHPVHLINRVPSPLLQNKSPYQCLYNELPIISHLKVFGCLAFANTIISNRTKFDQRARKTVFIGYKEGSKGYILYDLKSHTILLSRNVLFYENDFPFQTIPSDPIAVQNEIPNPNTTPSLTYPSHSYTEPPSPISAMPQTRLDENTQLSLLNNDHPIPTRQSLRPKRPSSHLQDYYCNTFSNFVKNKPNVAHPLSSVLCYTNCSPNYRSFCLSISSSQEPSSYAQASKIPCWEEAMKNELQALAINDTWSLVELPEDKHLIGCKWVYKTKYHADGSLERHKARLVAKGYTQMEGVDYSNTFSHVVKITTIRVVLALAAAKTWHLEQLDINNAFLHGDLHEEVYMVPPPGLSLPQPNLVCKLHKSLYGLKQASREWHTTLSAKLISLGYSHSQADQALFTKGTPTSFTAILVYVDDLVLIGNNLVELKHVKHVLHQCFRIKDLGPLRYFLGLEISKSKHGIHLNQRKYTLSLIEESGCLASRLVKTPFDPSIKLQLNQGEPFKDPSCYSRLVGRLLYLTISRPDISYFVQQLSLFMAKPMETHYKVALRVLHYLKASPAQGLLFSSRSTLKLSAFADSDWACYLDTRKSLTGFCIFLGDSLVSWKTKKQNIVSRSSSEAEYRALGSLACEIQWLNYLFADFQIPIQNPTSVYCDNKSTIYLAHNPVFH